jgi:Tfp pilus assembly protein PilP
MFRIKKSNRWIILLLSSSALVVWGVILYQVITGIEFEQEMDMQFGNVQTSVANEPPPWYDDSFIEGGKEMRNPFMMKLRQVKKTNPQPVRKIKPKPSEPERLPDLSFIGYLSDGSASLALIEFSEGETHICREGDSLKTVRLQEIDKNKIKITQRGNTHILPLKR